MKDGILNIYKHKNMTSFDVVAILRGVLKIRKIGHTGTLDPDATGVLPVCIGKATKLVSLLEDTDKTYRARMVLGKKTDTQDISGTVTEELSDDLIFEQLGIKGISTDSAVEVFMNQVVSATEKLTGEIEQIPPMYSALKVNGVKLVDAARKGQVIERKPRKITIYEYRNLTVDPDLKHITFDVKCSKGTYIRTLCEDLGGLLGLPACMEELERIEACGLKAEDAISIQELRKIEDLALIESMILPVDRFLERYEALHVTDDANKKVLVGNFLYPEDVKEGGFKDATYRVYGAGGDFLALYKYNAEKECLKPEKMFL